jgi:chromosome segregation ATPase
VDAQGKLDQCRAELRTALDRLTALEALAETHEAGKDLVDEAQEEIERLELANHDLQREMMGLEALLEEARQATEAEKRQLAIMEVGLEEATAKAQASVDEIIQLKMAEAHLINQVTHLEAERAQDQARISLMQEERDAWRMRAEDEVSEWVGILAEQDGNPEDKRDEVAVAALVTEAVVDAGDTAEVGAAAAATRTTGAAVATTTSTPLTPPGREELGGIDPVEALVEENLALRAQIEGLRRGEAEIQSSV